MCKTFEHSIKQGEIQGNTFFFKEMSVCTYCALCYNIKNAITSQSVDTAAIYQQVAVGMPFQEIYVAT